jgi:hypothetical protein
MLKGDRKTMQLGVFGELLIFGQFGAPEPSRR